MINKPLAGRSVLLKTALLFFAFYSSSFSQIRNDSNIVFRLDQTSFINKPITSFSLAGLGIDGSNNAVNVFAINLRNNGTTNLTGLRLKVFVYLNGTLLYEAWSRSFSLNSGIALPILQSSDFFNRDRSHVAEGNETKYKLNEAAIKSLGLTNLIGAPSGLIRIEAKLNQTLTGPPPVNVTISPTGNANGYAEYKIVTVPEITILGPTGQLQADAAPWFRWQSVLDALPYTENKYRLEIFDHNSYNNSTTTGPAMYKVELNENNHLYPAAIAPTLVPGSTYAWQVTALLQGPNMTTDAYDEHLKSRLNTFYYPGTDGQSHGAQSVSQNYVPPANPAATEAAITAAVKELEDMINGLKNGVTVDPQKLTQAINTLDSYYSTDISFDGRKIAIYELAQIINRAIGGGYDSVSVTTQVDATQNKSDQPGTTGNILHFNNILLK